MAIKQDRRGYILLHRSIEDHYYEPLCKVMAWIDLILLASHKESQYQCKGSFINVPRGSLAWSLESIAHRWRWSRNKVKRWLIVLQNGRQVDMKKTGIITLISIVNYEQYQVGRPVNGRQMNHQTDGRRTHTKNEKELKNSGNGKSAFSALPSATNHPKYRDL